MNQWLENSVLHLFFLLATCLWVSCHHKPAEAAAPTSCSTLGKPAKPSDEASAIALQKNIQADQMYKKLASKSPHVSCRKIFREAGKFELNYRFGNHAWLQLKRDAHIEFTQWQLRFTDALLEPAQAILSRVERWSFGPTGCRIDWSASETQAAEDDASANESIYRGTVCNCQARIRRNTDGRINGLTLSSAC